MVIVVNKWGPGREKELKQRSFDQAVRDRLKFLPWAPIIFASAQSGKGLSAILAAASAAHAASRTRVATGPLNRALGRAAEAHAPKAAKGNHAVKLMFSTQIGIDPPTFVITINHPVDLHFSYKRYLENQLRKEFGFAGTPLVLKVRARQH